MELLQLTTIVRDVQTGTMTAQTFTRSPVLVGRQYGNQLRLDAHIVSRRHGAFLFSKDGLEYIDYASANGTLVDGIHVAPNVPTDVRSSSVITIAPFQIVAQIDLVDAKRLSNDPNAATPAVEMLRPRVTTPRCPLLEGSPRRRRGDAPDGSRAWALRAASSRDVGARRSWPKECSPLAAGPRRRGRRCVWPRPPTRWSHCC